MVTSAPVLLQVCRWLAGCARGGCLGPACRAAGRALDGAWWGWLQSFGGHLCSTQCRHPLLLLPLPKQKGVTLGPMELAAEHPCGRGQVQQPANLHKPNRSSLSGANLSPGHRLGPSHLRLPEHFHFTAYPKPLTQSSSCCLPSITWGEKIALGLERMHVYVPESDSRSFSNIRPICLLGSICLYVLS